MVDSYLAHYGVVGMRWGVRNNRKESKLYKKASKRAGISKYFNDDGSYTKKGSKRYRLSSKYEDSISNWRKGSKRYAKDATKTLNALDKARAVAEFRNTLHQKEVERLSNLYTKRLYNKVSYNKANKIKNKLTKAEIRNRISSKIAEAASSKLYDMERELSDGVFDISKKKIKRSVDRSTVIIPNPIGGTSMLTFNKKAPGTKYTVNSTVKR